MSTSLSPDYKRIWRAARGPVIIGLIIVAAAIVIALARGGGEDGALDPDSVSPQGSRAIARLLEQQGVQIREVGSIEDAYDAVTGDSTLLITQPNWLGTQQLRTLREQAGATVAIAATDGALVGLAPSTLREILIEPMNRQPGCEFGAAGVVYIGGVTYNGPTRCYDGTVVRDGNVTLLGDAAPLVNDTLDQEGNAALGLRILGQHRQLVWYTPTLADAAAGGGGSGGGDDAGEGSGLDSLYSLVPAGWWFALGQVAVAVLLFMAWRARRLGPIVTEPLPVVVRAAETTEGRARLYRRAKATDHAADALRRTTIGKLIPLLGLPSDATPAAITESVTARTGRPGVEVHAVLFGPPPTTEQALVQIADDLDALLNEVGSR
ncbi:DUF4350 domain-containing protein [Kibdelosporangium aridum]|uniref:DUF4350 domain-containing protein n=1 Tax=Kibdelosporangium aridum TaxID=2030 RepID=A0A428YRC4_KIBAR|nr:DUF4350 domain-containing protein [Kibdelosporangium aridum]RSM71480.1 DUF4350 domain-containing protein [Kibdelosporangium aridum]